MRYNVKKTTKYKFEQKMGKWHFIEDVEFETSLDAFNYFNQMIQQRGQMSSQIVQTHMGLDSVHKQMGELDVILNALRPGMVLVKKDAEKEYEKERKQRAKDISKGVTNAGTVFNQKKDSNGTN